MRRMTRRCCVGDAYSMVGTWSHGHRFLGMGGNSDGDHHSESPRDKHAHDADYGASSRRTGYASATAQERQEMRTRWERALYGGVHFEAGMHHRYAAAIAAEDTEKSFMCDDDGNRKSSNNTDSTTGSSSNDGDYGDRVYGCSRRGSGDADEQADDVKAIIARWSPEAELPGFLFRCLSPDKQSSYIVHRLTAAEKRIRYSLDYGSLLMMQHLNLGEMMLTESERLLNERGWMNEDLSRRICELRALAQKIKFDHDLD